MIVTKQGQDRNKPAATIGFWAALLTAVLNLWFFLAFVPAQPILVAPWQGLAAYTASFQPLPFLAWIVPCFFLAPMILTMMTCLHAWAQKEKHGFVCVSFLCAAQVFGKGKLQHWVRWTFMGTALTGLVLPIDPLFRLPLVPELVDGAAYALLGILAPALLALLFRRSKDSIVAVAQGNTGMSSF